VPSVMVRSTLLAIRMFLDRRPDGEHQVNQA
jgi:hypothetical protein